MMQEDTTLRPVEASEEQPEAERMAAAQTAPGGDPPRRLVLATYANAFLSLGLVPMISLAAPLRAAELSISPILIGLALGVPSLLPLIYSIQIGGLMDRHGTRRLMIGFAAVGTVAPLLYPISSFVWWLILLQVLTGFSYNMAWVGAQTALGRLFRGSASHAAKFAFAGSAGSFIGPLLVGYAWDLGGAWPAFGMIGAWSAGLLVVVRFIPLRKRAVGEAWQGFRWSDVIPDLRMYLAALRMLANRLVTFVILCTFIRLCVYSMQTTFYPVYLEQAQFSASTIGFLIALTSLVSSPASLLATWLARWFALPVVLLCSIVLALIAISITPALKTTAALAVAAIVAGAGIGISFPTAMASLSAMISQQSQGLSMGLRATANRAASLALPVGMGFVVQSVGIESSFWITGAALLLAIIGVGLVFYVTSSRTKDGGV